MQNFFSNKKRVLFLILAITLLVLSALKSAFFQAPTPIRHEVERKPGSILVTAAGDYGANSHTKQVLSEMARTEPDLTIALGDFKYEDLKTEENWCDFVHGYFKKTYPFLLIAGNHDAGSEEAEDGDIQNFKKCLPDHLGNIHGIYGEEYYFDYPAISPLARFILISPGIDLADPDPSYNKSDPVARKTWLTKAIQEARDKNIPWIIVGMHKDCISTGRKGCEIGKDIMNFLISSKVDLILQAHEHAYERSKSLSCFEIGRFVPSCVASEAEGNTYTKGAGTILTIVGTGGAPLYSVRSSDPEAPYFKVIGGDTERVHGFLELQISKSELIGEFVPVEKSQISDVFTIQSGL